MTDREIIFKVISKANPNGYKRFHVQDWHDQEHYGLITQFDTLLFRYNADTEDFITLKDIIFDHDFAKAFWGEEYNDNQPGYFEFTNDTHNIFWWEYHLQKMVLEDEPLKYLEKFLTVKTS